MLEGTTVDMLMHVTTVVVAAILFAVSYRSYMKKQNEKFLYVCAAFAVFAVKEALVTLSILNMAFTGITWVSHFLNLVILGLFFRGTVK